MRVVPLQSGSNGNCIYVEANGLRLLFDAGIAGSVAQKRLAALGVGDPSVDALLISHEHSDHVRYLGSLHRQFDVPIHVTKKTLAAARQGYDLGDITEVHTFQAGSTLRFDGVCVETIPTPHDAVDGVAFVVDDGQSRLGILTDLGHVFDGLSEVVASLDAVVIESNYDPEMLADGPYPEFLKQRIRGPNGHLSNLEAAELIASGGRRLQWACLAHLSGRNNSPSLARRTHRELVQERFPICIASRHRATEMPGVS